MDADNVEVSLGSETMLVARASIEHWGAEKIILDPERLSAVPLVQLSEFVSSCQESEAFVVITTAVGEIFRRGYSEFSARVFLQKSQAAPEILQTVLLQNNWESHLRESDSHESAKNISESLAELMLADPAWIKSKVPRLFYLLSAPVSEYLISRLAEELQSEKSEYTGILRNALEVVGDLNSAGMAFLARASRLAMDIPAADFDAEKVKLLLDEIGDSRELTLLLYQSVASRISSEILAAVAAGQPDRAVRAASLYMPDRRSPQSIDALLTLLEMLKKRPDFDISQDLQRVYLSTAEADPKLRVAYLDYLDSLFTSALDAGKHHDANQLFSQIIKIRPDPDALNDLLRFNHALIYARGGFSAEADSKLSEMSTSPGFYQRFQIFFTGTSLFALLLMFVLPVLLIVAYKFMPQQAFSTIGLALSRLAQYKSKAADTLSGAKDSKNKASDGISTGFTGPGMGLAQNPVRREYEKKLARFNLPADASLRDVKSAYRLAVKECHPDLNPSLINNPNLIKMNEVRFADLTRNYEELLELRKNLGMDD